MGQMLVRDWKDKIERILLEEAALLEIWTAIKGA